MTTPTVLRASAASLAESNPLTTTRPESGRVSVASTLRSVVLPDPFGPKIVKTSPAETSISSPERTPLEPYDLARPRAAIANSGDDCGPPPAAGFGMFEMFRAVSVRPSKARSRGVVVVRGMEGREAASGTHRLHGLQHPVTVPHIAARVFELYRPFSQPEDRHIRRRARLQGPHHDRETKEALHKQRIFLDSNTIVVGETGFLSLLKQSKLLYLARDSLQKVIPDQRIVAVRIGSHRVESQAIYAEQLGKELNGKDKFLLEIWLPLDILSLAQRAFDVNFYWPSECTQSGVMANALGAGAIIAGRDLEGAGEMLKEAGQLVDTDLRHLIMKIKKLIRNPELKERIEEKALGYAEEFSWENQTRKHYELAESILHMRSLWAVPYPPWTIDTVLAPTANRLKLKAPTQN